jgi:hypothetical protein
VLAEFATGIASAMAKEMASLRQEFRTEADALALQVHKLEAAQETTPAQSYARAAARTDNPRPMPGFSEPSPARPASRHHRT